MYGTEASSASALAATGLGLATGSWVLAAVGIVFVGMALYLLFRKESKVKP